MSSRSRYTSGTYKRRRPLSDTDSSSSSSSKPPAMTTDAKHQKEAYPASSEASTKAVIDESNQISRGWKTSEMTQQFQRSLDLHASKKSKNSSSPSKSTASSPDKKPHRIPTIATSHTQAPKRLPSIRFSCRSKNTSEVMPNDPGHR
jgi:hypothetical protein